MYILPYNMTYIKLFKLLHITFHLRHTAIMLDRQYAQ